MAMMQMPPPLTRDLVLIGGGHTHALVLRMWGMRPLPGVRLTLINPDPTAAYSGMLPGYVAGHYPLNALQIDMVKLARFAGARLVLSRAIGIDRANQRIQIQDRADIAYDIASIDIGIESGLPELADLGANGVSAKPLGEFANRWAAYLADVSKGTRAPRVAVIGGGLAGVEIALAAAHRLGGGAQITMIEAATPLAAVGLGARRVLLGRLDQAGVRIVMGMARAVTDQGVTLDDGRCIAADMTIGAAGAIAQSWLKETGLALEGGFVRITPSLQSETDPNIFAVGDVAHMGYAPRPKAGVFAVRQAPVLLQNLRAASLGQKVTKNYLPQRDYLKLISTGGKSAVADKWSLPLSGQWLWRWKDRIDRKFMDKLLVLPVMSVTPAHSDTLQDTPLCGGCGAKVGRPALLAALDQLPPPKRPDVVKGAGDDAAILRLGKGFQVISTDHLRGFCEDPWLMSRITAIHALGDVWSMGATPQSALAQITLPVMTERQQAETLREIMFAAQGVFGPEGADIVGGHTSMGAELSIGFTVTGLTQTPAIGHSGAKIGDRLLLTKAIGTGVILAAEMQGRAPGTVVATAYGAMARAQGDVARLLAPHAHAMTDVTGFGLAGHLLSILQASELSARVEIADVPILPGAEDLAALGHGSSLMPANRQARAHMVFRSSPKADLLFDPQTAGGLLACVPAEIADELLGCLLDMGETAALIGTLGEGPASITVLG